MCKLYFEKIHYSKVLSICLTFCSDTVRVYLPYHVRDFSQTSRNFSAPWEGVLCTAPPTTKAQSSRSHFGVKAVWIIYHGDRPCFCTVYPLPFCFQVYHNMKVQVTIWETNQFCFQLLFMLRSCVLLLCFKTVLMFLLIRVWSPWFRDSDLKAKRYRLEPSVQGVMLSVASKYLHLCTILKMVKLPVT